MRPEELLSLLGARNTDPAVESALVYCRVRNRPEVKIDEDDTDGPVVENQSWVKNSRAGIEFGFCDEAAWRGLDETQFGQGPMVLTEIYFTAPTNACARESWTRRASASVATSAIGGASFARSIVRPSQRTQARGDRASTTALHQKALEPRRHRRGDLETVTRGQGPRKYTGAAIFGHRRPLAFRELARCDCGGRYRRARDEDLAQEVHA